MGWQSYIFSKRVTLIAGISNGGFWTLVIQLPMEIAGIFKDKNVI